MTRKKTNASADAAEKKSALEKKSIVAAAILAPVSTTETVLPDGEIRLDLVDFYPRNYRKFYDPKALSEFSNGMKALGRVISPITVRVVIDGRYQLVAGERRVRAARLAGFTRIPAVIGNFTDEEVEEIQLQENIQREDPHPMHEAESIKRMYARGLATQDISLRLGKSVTWVYNRHRLSGLTTDLQDMFLAGVFTLSQAYEIAELSPEAQRVFYERHCNGWKEQPPRFYNLNHTLASFKCDLSRVLFDLSDADLSPEAGACTGCQFNTAFKGLLLPDTEGIAMCTRRACFEKKTTLQLGRTISLALATDEPVAFIIDGQLSDDFKSVLDTIPGTVDLPMYQVENITLIELPEKPDIQDYQFEPEDSWDYQNEEEDGDESSAGHTEALATNGEDSEESDNETFDREGFEAAEQEYAEATAAYQKEITNGKSLKGLLLSKEELKIVFYYPVFSGKRLAAKDGKTPKIKDLIAAKQDTPEILQAEIKRIQARETRYKELDQEKIQKQVHTELVESTTAENALCSLTNEDNFAVRWLVLHSVTYEVRNDAETISGVEVDRGSDPEEIYQAISKMTDAQFSGLIRVALSGIPESKIPRSITGYFLKQVAAGAGVDIARIEKKQSEKAQTRVDNQEVKIALYKKRIKRHQGKAAA